MNKYEYWEKLSAKNPNLKCDIIRISSEKLKAIVFQAFDKGWQDKSKRKSGKTGFKTFDDIFHNT